MLWDNVPDVPVTVTVDVPKVAVGEAVKVNNEVTLPPDGGVTGFGLNAAVTPLGRFVAERVVAELKPLTLVTVIVLVALLPWLTVTDDGDAPMVKSGVPPPTAKIRSS